MYTQWKNDVRETFSFKTYKRRLHSKRTKNVRTGIIKDLSNDLIVIFKIYFYLYRDMSYNEITVFPTFDQKILNSLVEL